MEYKMGNAYLGLFFPYLEYGTGVGDTIKNSKIFKFDFETVFDFDMCAYAYVVTLREDSLIKENRAESKDNLGCVKVSFIRKNIR